ncbi:MAG: ACT domain-containing protein [Candidatus Micrarchaeota archaeon]
MKEVTIVTKNRVGALADVCEALGKFGVNIQAISAQGIGDSGVIRLITTDEKTAQKVLERAGFSVRLGDVLTLKLFDRPGELGKIARKLANAEISIDSVYILGKERGSTEVAITAGKIEEAARALKK